jgi:hypothetical protein
VLAPRDGTDAVGDRGCRASLVDQPPPGPARSAGHAGDDEIDADQRTIAQAASAAVAASTPWRAGERCAESFFTRALPVRRATVGRVEPVPV